MSEHRAYRQWRMRCDTCKGRFNYRCWNDEVPVKCACSGTLTEVKDEPEYYPNYDPTLSWTPMYSPRISSNDEQEILEDLGVEHRWPEHLGG